MSLSSLKVCALALVLWAQGAIADPPPPTDDLDAELQTLVDELESTLVVAQCPIGELQDSPALAACFERTRQWELATLRLDPREPAAAARPIAEPHGGEPPSTTPGRPTHED